MRAYREGSRWREGKAPIASGDRGFFWPYGSPRGRIGGRKIHARQSCFADTDKGSVKWHVKKSRRSAATRTILDVTGHRD